MTDEDYSGGAAHCWRGAARTLTARPARCDLGDPHDRVSGQSSRSPIRGPGHDGVDGRTKPGRAAGSLSLPGGLTRGGLPIGAQLVATAGTDLSLLRLAQEPRRLGIPALDETDCARAARSLRAARQNVHRMAVAPVSVPATAGRPGRLPQ